MSRIHVTRWQRYGHDRAYAKSASGQPLGMIDLTTGAITAEPGADAQAVEAALREFAAMIGQAPPASQAATAPTDSPSTVTDSPPNPAEPPAATWHDLATHRPGELVRQKATEEWEAAKDRSKLFAYVGRVLDAKTEERAWRVGADGEEVIGAKLEKLRKDGWHVLHSIPVGTGDSDIDHVLVGPGSVFTINSKNHPGSKIWVSQYQVRVAGQPVQYLRNARHESQRASKLLSQRLGADIPVVSCIVVLTGSLVPEVTIRQMPDDVMVLDKWDTPR